MQLFIKTIGTTALLTIAQSGFAQFAEKQVPGYYHIPVGQFQVTALYDGLNQLPVSVFQNADPVQIQKLLNDAFVDTNSGVQTSVNAYLVNTGKQLVLVDSGAAQCFGNSLGSIATNLKAAGYQPEQINIVLLTHLHPDHACGISVNAGEKTFPNATVYANKQEADFWLNNQNLKKLPQDKQQLFKGAFEKAQVILKPYQTAKQFKTYQAGDKIVDGIDIVPSYGHTAGHTSYLVHSGENKLLILGDVVHNHILQFNHPEIGFVYDYDVKQAVATRKLQFAQAAKAGYPIAAAHLPFPGIGYVQQTAVDQFVWQPVQFNPNVSPEQK